MHCLLRPLAQEISQTCRQLINDHIRWCDEVVGSTRPRPCVHGDLHQILDGGAPDPATHSFRQRLRSIDSPAAFGAILLRAQFLGRLPGSLTTT